MTDSEWIEKQIKDRERFKRKILRWIDRKMNRQLDRFIEIYLDKQIMDGQIYKNIYE